VSDAKKNSVLIVDDETSNLMALTHILSREYVVYAAKNGPDALETAKEHVPDVILLDILMPEMDGYEVIAALKASDDTRTIPVIFITGLDSAMEEAKGLTLGAADYIAKPFSDAIVKLRVHNQMTMLKHIRTIEDLSMIDPLTGIPNRRSFDERMLMEWGRGIRMASPLSVLLLDLDNFKLYNDTYGHIQGDVLLRLIARVLDHELKRSGDFFARWGGEEFVALLVDTHADGAYIVAEKMRKIVADTFSPLADGRETRITISIGLNSQIPVKNAPIREFLHHADIALYAAKHGGKNRVCRHENAYQPDEDQAAPVDATRPDPAKA
jgi:diguanylate cyclase (GGDEF)-like protein